MTWGMIRDGALLLQGGKVLEMGPSRRLENLTVARGAREIDGQRETAVERADERRDQEAGRRDHARGEDGRHRFGARLRHAYAPSSRKDRSASSTPRRRVGRDTSWSNS